MRGCGAGGVGGEFERHPGKEITAFGLRCGKVWGGCFPVLRQETRRLATPDCPVKDRSWIDGNPTPFEVGIVVGTAALALETLGLTDCEDRARPLFNFRMPDMAA